MTRRKRIKTPQGAFLPARIQIAAVWYTVTIAPEAREEDLGSCDSLRKIINIDVAKHPDAEAVMVTWKHETGHAIEEEYGIPMTDKNTDRYAQGRAQEFWQFVEVQE